MMRLRIGLLFAALGLSACDHHQSADQVGTAAVGQGDSDLTGIPQTPSNAAATPVYPRATLVALPADETASAPATDVSPPPLDQSTTSTGTAPPDASSIAASPPSPPPDTASSMSSASLPPPDQAATPPAINTGTPVPASSSAIGAPDATAQEQVVVLETSLGRIVVELDEADAPQTCANFRKLVSDGFYDRTAFHRVIPNFMIQGGDPNSKSDDRTRYGQGGPGYTLPPEIKLTHERGAIAMARLPDSVNPQRNSNGSQFYICVADCPSLDDNYTVFGHVIKGMDVADKIARQARDVRDDPINRIEIEASMEPKANAIEDDSSGHL